MRFGRFVCVLPVLCVLAACERSRLAPPPLTIQHTSPTLAADASPLLLNDSITVYFSEPILPLSVTTDSFTLVDAAGHQVPGSLRTGARWVSFLPDPPLTPELDDGSFVPGATYRLLIAGSPRPDAVRGRDGQRLTTSAGFTFQVAALDRPPAGLPAPLRPSANDVPFVLRAPEVPQQLPVDAPRLLLHFTQPVLPPSVTPDAFEVLLQRYPPQSLAPRSARVVTSRLDDQPGCTVEVDLGALPPLLEGGGVANLRAGDWVSIALRRDRPRLVDYAGNPPLSALPQMWNVVAGASIALAEWPSREDDFDDETGLSAGFEVHGGVVRPRVRLEAGDGSLGVLRPRRDLTLRPGEPFDRGDGTVVVSRGRDFPFLSVEVPPGVVVTLDAGAGARVQSLGDLRIAGELVVRGPAGEVPPRRSPSPPLRDLLAGAPIALIAAGDVWIDGHVRSAGQPVDAESPLLIASADSLRLRGTLPFQAVLVVEEAAGERGARIFGPRGQSLVRAATMSYGIAATQEVRVRGSAPWRQLPLDHDGGVLRLTDAGPGLGVAWQGTPAQPGRADQPDVSLGRSTRLQAIGDQGVLSLPGGHFVRLELTAVLQADRAVPTVRELRLCDR